MRNNKINTCLILAAALVIGSYIPALADDSIGVSINGSVNVGSESSVKSSSSASVKSDNRDESSNDNIIANEESHATTTVSETAIENRSAVAAFVQRLLSTANRISGGIGSEIRVIAKEQNDSSSTTAEAIVKVEARGGIMTFLFGTDYKNAGVIRSELAKTDKRIARLSELASLTSVSAETKVELNAEIKSLTDAQVKLDAFVKAHESQFSLFGWFVKIFVK